VALGWLQTRQPELDYSSPETIPYYGNGKNIAVYQVSILNSGKKSAFNVVCYVQVSGAHIDGTRIAADKAASPVETPSSDGDRLSIPELNPGETAVMSLLASSDGTLPLKPSVWLRGSGVAGKESSDPSREKSGTNESILVSVLAPLLGLVAMTGMLTFTTIKRLKKREAVTNADGKHSDDQREILAYLCGLCNLNEEAERLLSLPGETSYWAQADRFATKAVASTKDEARKYKAVLKGLLEYAGLASSSEGIVCYDIARIAAAHGELDEARKYLQLAKPKMGRLLETRLKLDLNLAGLVSPS
jgi:hypothetical protein